MQAEKQIVFGKYHDHDEECYDDTGHRVCGYRQDELVVVHLPSTEQLLANFFQIDLNKVEDERRALLDYLRQKGQRDA